MSIELDSAEALKALEEQALEILREWAEHNYVDVVKSLIGEKDPEVEVFTSTNWPLPAPFHKVEDCPPPKAAHILMRTKRGIVSSGKYRYGTLGEPQQDVLDWRCNCCEGFGGMFEWMEAPK